MSDRAPLGTLATRAALAQARRYGWLELVPSPIPDCVVLAHTGIGLRVIASLAWEEDLKRWLHVSVSHAQRLPTWEELRAVKAAFVGPDRAALQVFPRADEYVNHHPYTLHLWHCLEGDVTPDFRREGLI